MNSVWQTVKHVKQFVIVLLFYAVAFCFAMFQGGFTSWFIFFTITPFVLYAVVFQFMPLSFRNVTRDVIPATLTAGDAVTVTLTVERSNRFPLCFITLQDDMTNTYTVKRRQLQFAGFRKTFTWELTHRELSRGEYTFQTLHIKCYDFFKWGARSFNVKAPQSFYVQPRVQSVRHAAVETQLEHGATNSRYAAVKDTSLVTGVRNYQPGDRMSWIHWKSFAKTEQLRTKDFEDTQSQRIMLMLDLKEGREFEAAVSLAASLLKTFIKQQSQTVFMTLGKECQVFPSLQNAAQMNEVMQHLAVVQPTSDGQQQLLPSIIQQDGACLYVSATFAEEQLYALQQLRKPVVCIIVSEMQKPRVQIQNVHIMYVPPTAFNDVLKEVAKR